MTDQQLLQLIYKNAEMGRDGLEKLIERTDDRSLRRTLARQFAEYQDVMNEAKDRLADFKEEPKGAPGMVKASQGMMTQMMTGVDASSTKMAEMVIEGSTQGVIKLTREMHDYEGVDNRARELAEKLLRTEQSNIERLRQFL